VYKLIELCSGDKRNQSVATLAGIKLKIIKFGKE
jgi:hypothetical protein